MKPLEILFDNDATEVAGISTKEIKERLLAAMPDAQIKLYDLTGDGSHYQLEVASKAFAGQSRIAQHRQVNAVFADVLGKALHALALKTTPL